MELPDAGAVQTSGKILTLWMVQYHTGPDEEITQSTPMFINLFYAENAEDARTKLDALKPKLREDLLRGGWSGELWIESLEPTRGGFNTGQRWFEGKIEIDAEGKPKPKAKPIRYR